MLPDIAWDGSEQDFSDSQHLKVDELLRSIPSSERQCHMIIKLFVLNISQLLADGYVIHHIDGDHWNNYPGNLMVMLRGAHTRWHWEHCTPGEYDARCDNIRQSVKRSWDELTLEEYIARCNINLKSKTQEVCERIGTGMQKFWAGLSEEEYLVKGTEIYEGMEKAGMLSCHFRAEEYRANQIEPYTAKDLNEYANFARDDGARAWIVANVRVGKIEHIGYEGQRKLYRTLICEVTK